MARHFAVSTRTIYRELQTLSSLGVPLYTERGRNDIFHPEPAYQAPQTNTITGEQAARDESSTISTFFRAILDGNLVCLQYRSPYRGENADMLAEPLGLFWDRDRWYLVGKPVEQEQTVRLWRADRVVQIKLRQPVNRGEHAFDVRNLLGRNWLQSAMEQWRQRVPLKIRLSCSQAERLQQDWYYRHAHFEKIADDQMLMTFGETNSMLVLELLRWLGPGAELIEPKAWRGRMREELRQMLAYYTPE